MKPVSFLKQGFASLVENSDHSVLKVFVEWLDVRLAEFKVYGYFCYGDDEDLQFIKSVDQRVLNGVNEPQRNRTHTGKISPVQSEDLRSSAKETLVGHYLNGYTNQGQDEPTCGSRPAIQANSDKLKEVGFFTGGNTLYEGFQNGELDLATQKVSADDPVVLNSDKIDYPSVSHMDGDGPKPLALDQGKEYKNHCTSQDFPERQQNFFYSTLKDEPHILNGHLTNSFDCSKILNHNTEVSQVHCLQASDLSINANTLVTQHNHDLHFQHRQEVDFPESCQQRSIQNGSFPFANEINSHQNHLLSHRQTVIKGERKRGPPKLIAYRDDEPVEQWKCDEVIAQRQNGGSLEITSQCHTTKPPETAKQNGITVFKDPTGQAQHPFQKNGFSDKSESHITNNLMSVNTQESENGLDLSCKVQIIEPSFNASENTFERQTSWSFKMKNKVFKCPVCGRILLNSAGYNRHVKSHLKYKCPYCGLLCELKTRKKHKCFLHEGASDENRSGSLCSLTITTEAHSTLHGATCQPHANSTEPTQNESCGQNMVSSDRKSYAEQGVPNSDSQALTKPTETTENDKSSDMTQCESKHTNFPVGVTTCHLTDQYDPWGQYLRGLVCPMCSKQFLHLSSLNRHVKVHQGIFTHACAGCGRRFTRNEHFLQHRCKQSKHTNSWADNYVALEDTHNKHQTVLVD